jgi:exopolysaccharide production protein ExoZ
MAAMSQSKPLQSIQILRALAATLVVVGHSIHDSSYVAEHTARASIDVPFMNWGFGVDIFFVISGFIMIYTTSAAFGRPGAAYKFFARRFCRIAPLYWLMTLGLITVFFLAPHFLNVPIENLRSVITSCLFIPDIRGNGEVRPILALGWTLNYEMFFYAIFACCLTLPLRRGVTWLIGFFVLISLLGSTVALPGVALPFWANPITLEFVFGVLIGLACVNKWRLSAAQALLSAVAAIVLAVAFGPLWGMDDVLPRLVSAGLPAALFVAAAALGPSLTPTRIVTALAGVGDASYSLYLTHPFVLRPMRNAWMVIDHGALPLGLYVAVCLLIAIMAAIAIYRLVEKPLTKSLQRRADIWIKSRGATLPAANSAVAPIATR